MSAASGTPLVAKKPHPSAALPDAFPLPSLPCWVVPLCEPAAGSPPLRSFRHFVPGHSVSSLPQSPLQGKARSSVADFMPSPARYSSSIRKIPLRSRAAAPAHLLRSTVAEASGRPGLQPCIPLLRSLHSGLLAQRASLRFTPDRTLRRSHPHSHWYRQHFVLLSVPVRERPSSPASSFSCRSPAAPVGLPARLLRMAAPSAVAEAAAILNSPSHI